MKIRQLVTAIEAFEQQLADELRALPNAELVALARRAELASPHEPSRALGAPPIVHRDAKPDNVIPEADAPPHERRTLGRKPDPQSVSQRILAHVLSHGPVAPHEAQKAVGVVYSVTSYLARHRAAGSIIQHSDGRFAAPGTPEPP